MDLRKYLQENRYTVTAFSKLLGCSRVHLSEILANRRDPSLLLAKSIENFTNGEVTVAELMKEGEGKGE